ncbi:MAG TPA: peptidoglycan-binding protein [Granulicella sp.]|nr:peptidoglycan-binding protein [Granulicella sp.]
MCAQSNPDNNRFCGQCGAALDAASQKLREQIRDVIRQEFKNEDLVAVTVADKAEERLWRWSKMVGIAGLFASIGLAAFGFTSFDGARNQIKNAALLAAQDLRSVSDSTKKTLAQNTLTTLSQVEKTRLTAIADMQYEEQRTRTAADSVTLRTKATNEKLAAAEQQVAVLQSRLQAINEVRSKLPDTPIGAITNDLFKPTGFGQGGYGEGPYGGIAVISPYKEGTVGNGVRALQERLAALGCYSGQPSGIFDPATTAGVSAYVAANGSPSVDAYLGLSATSADAPSPVIVDGSTGTVDYGMWRAIFAPLAKHCQ